MSTVVITFLSSCANNNPPEERKLPSNDSSVFYPVKDFFINQLLKADSFTHITYIYTDADNRNDSTIIDAAKLRELAAPFTADDINDTAIKKYYRESIFHDATTASNTFNYTSVNSTLPIQTIDILLDTATSAVKRIFITRNFVKGDTIFTEKMGWKTDHSFSINRIIQLPGKKESTQQINVFWNSNN